MAAVINTNISSLNSQRNLTSSSGSLANSLQRLSSGLRINSAKDDAAGLAISSRMTAQISGLNQAARNANDGISLAQTAEGALASVGDALLRMRELSVQSANATNSASDRASLQKEVDQLVQQINTVAGQTSFNGIKLLDGTFNAQAFQIGANAGETITVSSIASAKVDSLGVGTNSSYKTDVSSTAVSANAISSGGITVNGYGIGPSVADGVSYNAATTVAGTAAAAAIASQASGATRAASTLSGLSINGVTISDITLRAANADSGATTAAVTASEAADLIIAGINAQSDETGVTATQSSGTITLSSANGEDVVVAGGSAASGLANATTTGLGGQTSSAISKAAAFNAVSGQTGVTATVSATTVTGGVATVGAIAGDSTDYIKINGITLGAIAAGKAGDAASQANNVAAAINAVSDKTGVTATFDTAGKLTLNAADGRNINIDAGGTGDNNSGLTAGTTFATVSLTSSGSGGIALGGSDIATAGLSAGSNAATATFGAGLSTVDITTASGAQTALATIDSALTAINNSRANLGAVQNRFTNVVSNLSTSSENISAARSRILDADFAAETANLSRAQILQQAGTAMLAQANALPQNVLSLLR